MRLIHVTHRQLDGSFSRRASAERMYTIQTQVSQGWQTSLLEDLANNLARDSWHRNGINDHKSRRYNFCPSDRVASSMVKTTNLDAVKTSTGLARQSQLSYYTDPS